MFSLMSVTVLCHNLTYISFPWFLSKGDCGDLFFPPLQQKTDGTMPMEQAKEEKYICTVERRGGPAPEVEAVLHLYKRRKKKKNYKTNRREKSKVHGRKWHPVQKGDSGGRAHHLRS